MVKQIVVRLEGGEDIVVRRDGGAHIELESPGRWRQRLRIEEAWALAEGLEEISTSATEGPEVK